MISGSLEPVMLVAERRRMAGAEPGWPESVTTLAPAILPLKLAIGDRPGASLIAPASTAATVKGAIFCDVAAEVPVTTIWSRLSTSRTRSKSFVTRPGTSVTLIVLGL